MMTNTLKHKNDISISQIFEWSATNLNRGQQLAPIERSSVNIETTPIENMDIIGLPDHTCISLDSPGIIHLFKWIIDPAFQNMPPNIRKVTIREFETELQLRTDTLKGTRLSRKRKEIHNIICEIADNKCLQNDKWRDAMNALSFMNDVQVILVWLNNKNKTDTSNRQNLHDINENIYSGNTITFASNPTTWTIDKPIWIADYNARWIAVPEHTTYIKTQQSINNWFSNRESAGWTIDWPVIEGKKSELIEQLQTSPAWLPEHSKFTKDILSKRLGKYLTLRTLYPPNL